MASSGIAKVWLFLECIGNDNTAAAAADDDATGDADDDDTADDNDDADADDDGVYLRSAALSGLPSLQLIIWCLFLTNHFLSVSSDHYLYLQLYFS